MGGLVRGRLVAATARIDLAAHGGRRRRRDRRGGPPSASPGAEARPKPVRRVYPSAGNLIHPLLRDFANEMQATVVRVAAYAAVIALMGLMAFEFFPVRHESVAAPAAAPEWIEVGKPIPAFAIAIPEISGEPQCAIRRHASGGGRKDIFSFGEADGLSAAIEIYRAGTEDARAEPLSIPELRLSATRKLNEIATKFGPVSLDSYTDEARERPRQCVRFARDFDEPRVIISGHFCNPGLEVVDRRMVACALDRLTLVSAGSDQKIGALFARAELKRSFCGANNVIFAATPKRRTGSRRRAIPSHAAGNSPIRRSLLAERILPAAAILCARRVGGLQIIQDRLAVLRVRAPACCGGGPSG